MTVVKILPRVLRVGQGWLCGTPQSGSSPYFWRQHKPPDAKLAKQLIMEVGANTTCSKGEGLNIGACKKKMVKTLI